PGTTRQCRDYPMRVAGQTLYTLVDTPGFERPRHVLSWLKEHETSTAGRRATVEQFVEQHERAGQFEQECELLRPILQGAAILYVVDGSKPPSPKYEAEMEILRWTAQPRVALINATSDEDYSHKWRSMLDQFFNMVRPFNAHRAGFDERVRLLKMLREMSESTREPLEQAIRSLNEDRKANLREAAEGIAELLVAMITHVEEKRLAKEGEPAEYEKALAAGYFDTLRRTERGGHNRLKRIFSHHQLEVSETELEFGNDDLFDLDTWNRLGLSSTQLTTAGAAAGAVAGGMVDAASAAISFPFGTLVGIAAGGAASWLAARKLPEVKIQGFPLGGQLLKIGPMKNPSFPWVVLDRALLYLDVVADRSHASRNDVDLPAADEGIVGEIAGGTRRAIERSFHTLRRKSSPEAVDSTCTELANQLHEVIQERHPIGA
ncbi:MAG: DUF3482 domain-containing protein, partial [Pirellulales bacterium]